MSEARRNTVMITGSNRGIGRRVLETAAMQGYDIIAHARTDTDEWRVEILKIKKTYNVDVKEVYFDLCDLDKITQTFSFLSKAHVSIDHLVNNAGITSYNTPFLMTSMTEIRKMFEVNVFAMMAVTQYCLRNMIRRKRGSIVNLASICGEDVLPSNTIYGSSKAAVIAFTKNLASEVGKYGVRVNAIAPGVVDTDMIEPVKEYFDGQYISSVALGRLGETDDIAKAVMFLLSDESSYITGQTLRVDGGKF